MAQFCSPQMAIIGRFRHIQCVHVAASRHKVLCDPVHACHQSSKFRVLLGAVRMRTESHFVSIWFGGLQDLKVCSEILAQQDKI